MIDSTKLNHSALDALRVGIVFELNTHISHYGAQGGTDRRCLAACVATHIHTYMHALLHTYTHTYTLDAVRDN